MQRSSYPTGLTDAQREKIRAAVRQPKAGAPGGPPIYPLREIWNAISYQAKNGCSWRALPHDSMAGGAESRPVPP